MKRCFNYECPQCGEDIEIDYWPDTPGVYSGPPERCYPDEPSDFEPRECPRCKAEIDHGAMDDLYADHCAGDADRLYDEWKERQLIDDDEN